MSNITQVINVDKNFRILKKSIHASDTDQVLSSSGPYTLLAPSDMAFQKLEKGMIDDLLEPQNRSKLAGLINNHVIQGRVDYNDLRDGDTVTTVNGKQWPVKVKNGSVMIGDANVEARMGKISNGVIHYTDQVLV